MWVLWGQPAVATAAASIHDRVHVVWFFKLRGKRECVSKVGCSTHEFAAAAGPHVGASIELLMLFLATASSVP